MTTCPDVTELVRFLLSCIDEDGRELKRLRKDRNTAIAEATYQVDVLTLDRQLSEIDAKRRLVGALQQLIVLRDQPMEKVVRDHAAMMLTAMTAPYSGHRGFRADWEPGRSGRPSV
jgi:hypothetical protein